MTHQGDFDTASLETEIQIPSAVQKPEPNASFPFQSSHNKATLSVKIQAKNVEESEQKLKKSKEISVLISKL